MKLKQLTIKVNESWEANPGKYTARIAYEGQTGAVEMNLDNDVSQALLLCVRETITAFAAKAVAQVQESIIASVAEAQKPQLEAETTTV